MSTLPPCGLYRTVTAIGSIPADRLVYFHNHGNPGPGLYVPTKWSHNRATFSPSGMTIPSEFDPASIRPLPREGFYRVAKTFHCCAKKCVEFQPDAMVQLGYNGAGKPILFHPQLAGGVITTPDRGNLIDDDMLANLVALTIAERKEGGGGDGEDNEALALPRGIIVH